MDDHDLFARVIMILKNQQEEIDKLTKEIRRQSKDIEDFKEMRIKLEIEIRLLREDVDSLNFRTAGLWRLK